MTSKKQEADIVKYPNQKQLNIGIVIFGILFVYLLATIVLYLTAPQVTVYEVRQGSILKDNAYTGLALREETVVYAKEDGYINYFAEDNSKVRVGSEIYTISDEKLEFQEDVSEEASTFTQEEERSFIYQIQEYNAQFQQHDFSSTYQWKSDLQHTLDKITNQSRNEQLEHSDLLINTSEIDGIIVYTFDGMEDLTTETVLSSQLNKSDYTKREFQNNDSIVSGDPIFKVITSDNWKLLIEVSEETKEILSNKKTVKVNLKKDNQQLRADISFPEHANSKIACLSFHNSMVRYASERYLDIELIIEDESGLKIPKTAETSKEFYVVPKSYLTQGGNSSNDGVMRQTVNGEGTGITEFFPVTVYYEQEDMVYLDPKVFDKNDTLIKPDSSETLLLKEKRSLKGVYCINKGYAVFKQIKILCESDEYYIIEEGNDFGLSNYDHIALDSSSIEENDVVF